MLDCAIPIIGFAAYSGTGKTTLLVKIIPVLKEKGLRVGVIKHAHHTFEIDQPGKDSYEIRMAGATQMLIGSKYRWALMVENEEIDPEIRLAYYIKQLDTALLDIILVEGFKPEAIPKIELHRPSLGNPLICENNSNVIAIACDGKLDKELTIPVLDLNNVNQIVEFILEYIKENH